MNTQIALPPDIWPDEARRIIEVATLVEGGALRGTWNQFIVTIPASGVEGLLKHVEGGSAFLELPIELMLGDQRMEVGPFQYKLLSARVEQPEIVLEQARTAIDPDELLTVVLRPGSNNGYEAFTSSPSTSSRSTSED